MDGYSVGEDCVVCKEGLVAMMAQGRVVAVIEEVE